MDGNQDAAGADASLLLELLLPVPVPVVPAAAPAVATADRGAAVAMEEVTVKVAVWLLPRRRVVRVVSRRQRHLLRPLPRWRDRWPRWRVVSRR